MSNIGSQINGLFSTTTEKKPEVKPINQAPTQPLEVNEQAPIKAKIKSVKTTITFNNNQLVWLDRLSIDIRAKNEAIIDRGAIIRAILTAVEISKIDLTNIKSEEELSLYLLSKLGK